MYSITKSLLDNSPFEDMFSLENWFKPADDMLRNVRDSFSNIGFKKIISRPHDLTFMKDDKGNTIGQKLSLVYTPFKKDQIKVSVVDNTLSVSIGGEEKVEKSEKDGEIIYKGISSQSTRFSLVLTDKVDKEKIKAKAEDGMLSIELPFVKEEEKKEIEVTVE